MTGLQPMRLTIDAVTFGATDLAARTPAAASILNRLPATDGRLHYWCVRLDEPLRFHYPADFDTTRCQLDYLDSDEAGPFLWVLVIVLCVLPYGAELTSNTGAADAELAYVIDNSLGYDVQLDRAKVTFVGTVRLTIEASSAHTEPEPPPAVDIPTQDRPGPQPGAAPAAPIFLDAGAGASGDSAEGDASQRREPLACNTHEFHAHLDRLVAELVDMAGRHPGAGPLVPRQLTTGTEAVEQTGFNLDDFPLAYRSWEPRAGWNTRATNDFDELLYWIIDDMARMLAWRLTVNAPSYPKFKPTRAQSILFFPYWRALVFAIDPDWGERTAASIGELILSRGQHPGPDADHYFDELNAAGSAVADEC